MLPPRLAAALLFTAGLTALPLASHAQTVTLDFDTESDYTANFRRTFLTFGSNNAFAHSAANQRLEHSATGGGTAVNVYDTAPDGLPTNLFSDVTVSFDFSSTINNVSLGIFFGGSERGTADYASAIFSLNHSGSADQIRFFTGGSLATGAAGTVSGSAIAATDTGFTTGKTYRATLDIEYQTGTSALVSFTISDPYEGAVTSFTASQLITGLSGSGEIAFRDAFVGTGGTISIDNLSISATAIPEPSTYALIGGAATLGLVLMRRRRRHM